MRITVISDLHTKHGSIPKEDSPGGDLIICAGDIMNSGYNKNDIWDFCHWYQSLDQYEDKVFIAGNHDKSFDPKFNDEISKPEWLQDELAALPSSIIYLENSYTTIDGIKIWGSPITPWFHGDRWAFNKQRGFDISCLIHNLIDFILRIKFIPF